MAEDFDDDKTQTHVILTKGTMVSHYRIIEKIGAGGMGEVYLAEDTKLNRKVALKFLPPHLCQDEDCRKRFTREAQAVAKLNHPNVITIYEVTEHQGRPFFSMENVEGLSLKDYGSDKELSFEQILELGIQICEGLNEAHEKGVTHRDIKPSNILIDSRGRAKIVDFGLASLVGSVQLTKTGSTLGTIGYMSPEQVQGKEIDHRSDLFSLGVVLYELITKQNPFKRNSEAATLKAVSDDLPEPLARFKSGFPDGLQTIIDKALEKDVKTRYQHADGMLSDLVWLKRQSDSVPSAASVVARGKYLRTSMRTGLGIAALIAILIVSYWALTREHDPGDRVTEHNQITFLGDVLKSEISPDASLIAYSRQATDVQTLEVRDLRGGKAVEIFSHQRIFDFRWSPDGAEILIAAHGEKMGLYVVPRLGGESRFYPFKAWSGTKVCWLPDGSGFLAKSPEYPKQILSINKTTGAGSYIDIDGPFVGFHYSECHPDGQRLLIQSLSPDAAIWTARMDGSDLRRACDGSGSGARWLPDGSAVIFISYKGHLRDLMMIKIDRKSGEPRGQPIQILTGIKADGGFSISADGRNIAFVEKVRYSDLWRVNLDFDTVNSTTGTEQITSGTQYFGLPDISLDGKWLAFTARSGDYRQIHVMRSDGTDRSQVTFADREMLSPAWSPDGSRIAFIATSEESHIVGIVDSDGSAMLFFDSTSCSRQLSWGPGQNIIYQGVDNRSLNLLDPESGDLRCLTDNSRGWTFAPTYSRDGSCIAFYWNYKLNDDSTGVWMIDSSGSLHFLVAWTRDETALYPLVWNENDSVIYCWNGSQVWAVEANNGNTTLIMDVPFSSVSGVRISPQLDFMICNVTEWKGDLWLVKHLNPYIK